MKITTGRAVLWVALFATVAAAVFAPEARQGSNTVEVVKSTSSHTSERSRPDPDKVLELKPRDMEGPPLGSFSSTIWPAPRPVSVRREALPPPAPVAAPVAPPLPFHVVGRYAANGKSAVFMQYNERTVVATEGMVIDDLYRVDNIGASSVALIYLPLNERQTLALPAGN